MKILIFDTETSGLPEERNGSILSTEKWPYVLQLSYILYDTSNNELIEYSDKLVKIPYFVYISPESENIHKITREKCYKEGVEIEKLLHDFNRVLTKTDLIIGHNIEFDKKVLMVEFVRNKIPHKFFINNIQVPYFCTMQKGKALCNLTFKTYDGRIIPKSPKLIELYRHFFNDEPNGLHNSLIDTIVCLRCYYKMQFDLDIFECSIDVKDLFNKSQ
tara:strand:+ start:433 stop:1083 length:651 start_codon:yes stop_codon:yes gene_type:complete